MTEKQTNSDDKMMTYKGKPLVRNGNILYYGDMKDDYVAMLTIKDTEKKLDMNIATKVAVQVISTDLTVPPDKLVIKNTEKNGLYSALKIADIWLERKN